MEAITIKLEAIASRFFLKFIKFLRFDLCLDWVLSAALSGCGDGCEHSSTICGGGGSSCRAENDNPAELKALIARWLRL